MNEIYEDNHAYLADELKKLDLLIQRRVLVFRQEMAGLAQTAASGQKLIADEEVDWLLQMAQAPLTPTTDEEALTQQLEALQAQIDTKVSHSLQQGVPLPLPHLAHLFSLSLFELQTIVICLAPELHSRYDTLYAYLQDEISQKKPTVGLVLDLLCLSESERWSARPTLTKTAQLFRTGLLHLMENAYSPAGVGSLGQQVALDARILHYILGHHQIDARIQTLVKIWPPLATELFIGDEIKTELDHLTAHHLSQMQTNKLTLYLCGPYGAGKQDLARHFCAELTCPLLYLDVNHLLAVGADSIPLLQVTFRESLLQQAAVYLDNGDSLLAETPLVELVRHRLNALVAEYGWLTFLAGSKTWTAKTLFQQMSFHVLTLPRPTTPMREAAWQQALTHWLPDGDPEWGPLLARQFRLTPGQIRDAVQLAQDGWIRNGRQTDITLADLFAACRAQSNQKLSELSLKITPRYTWSDIILPTDTLAQLQEIQAQVQHRYQVFRQWGFDQKLSHGKGLSVLFSGPPGTGKTMAAEVIAHELQIDLYKIDLSGVVSKYIGETEKNLSKIFNEAETSNAILFFDEADALFGKRTETSSAHDRYANIETSYLLQKMEEYEGVVVLATNLRGNMDDAFTRRIRFIVEFPFPDAASRQRIWQKHFPAEAPVSEDIDYEFLSKQFPIAGGNIKNIVLNAAFLAAENGAVINMRHLLQGTRREFEKVGKFWNEAFINQQLKR